jgi:hypothetical protein
VPSGFDVQGRKLRAGYKEVPHLGKKARIERTKALRCMRRCSWRRNQLDRTSLLQQYSDYRMLTPPRSRPQWSLSDATCMSPTCQLSGVALAQNIDCLMMHDCDVLSPLFGASLLAWHCGHRPRGAATRSWLTHLPPVWARLQ